MAMPNSFLKFCALSLIASVSAFAATPPPKAAKSTLLAEFPHIEPGPEGMTCIQTPEATIYYQGTAKGKLTDDGQRWAGTIKGKFLVVFKTDDIRSAGTRIESDRPGKLMIWPNGTYHPTDATISSPLRKNLAERE